MQYGQREEREESVTGSRKKVAEAREKKKQQEGRKKSKPPLKSGLGSKSPAEKKGLRMATKSSLRNRPGPPLEMTSTVTPSKQTVRKSLRFKETPTTPATPMPAVQVGDDSDEDDEPTFPMIGDPIR